MPVKYEYPELRRASIEAEARERREKPVRTIVYTPTDPKEVSTHLAIPGSIAVFVVRKGSKILEEIAAAARPISHDTAERLGRGQAMRRRFPSDGFDRGEAEAHLDALLTGAPITELAES